MSATDDFDFFDFDEDEWDDDRGHYVRSPYRAYAQNNAWIWVTRDGREIPVAKMENAHLFNTIKMLERLGHDGLPVYAALQEEARKRRLFEPVSDLPRSWLRRAKDFLITKLEK